MLDSVISLIRDITIHLREELYELPLTSPKTLEERWFPIVELYEVVVIE
jgi:hypothetical protein